jgi:CotH protein/chitobiase/beta-hexosaminidase-like protein/lamin tail-like protein
LNNRLLILLICLLSSLSWISNAQESPDIPATQTLKDGTKKKKNKHLELEFSIKGGFYNETVSVALTSTGATIYYTLDGSTPNSRSDIYTTPINCTSTTIIRAVARKGKMLSKVIGHTYFINEPYTNFPVISIGVTPSILFDPEHGLYVKGPNAQDSTWKLDGANFWSRKEIKVNTEFFEVDGENEFNSVTGLRLFGGMSRLFPQKSMTIVTRDRYGKKRIKHKVFEKDGLKKYKFLVLRNSGSDWGKSHFRDALMTGLLEDWDIEKQDYRPAHVYLNGKYWGIYNIREKVNRYFINGHQDIDKDSIDLIEHRITLKLGSTRHYRKMIQFVEQNSLADPTNYAYLQSQMDVDNFMQYQIAQIYFDNRDAGGNIKFWRPQTEDGKWRWIMYDTDWGFGLQSKDAYKFNSLAFHTDANGPSWPNPPWSTFLLRKLLENPTFKQEFLTRFADHLNSTFASSRVESAINGMYEQLLPEMDRHLERWNLKEENWKFHINIMRTFAKERPDYVRMHLMEMFDTGDLVNLEAEATTGGQLVINDQIKIENKLFKGQYFEKIPVQIRAIPKFGYRFIGWKGVELDNNSLEATIYLERGKTTSIKALFAPYKHPLAGSVMINEISCNNNKSGDWIEIYNYSKESVSLNNWYLTDNKHYFKIPDVTISPKDYVVLCQNKEKFLKIHPGFNIIGDFHFGLNKRHETLGLFTADGAAIDSVSYDLSPIDSAYTLNLALPYLNNSDIDNWEITYGNGSPNSANPFYLESRIKAEQKIWLRVGIGIGLVLLMSLMVSFKKRKHNPVQLQVSPTIEDTNSPSTSA